MEFCYIVRRSVLSEDDIQAASDALAHFEHHQVIFQTSGVRPTGFNIPRVHSLRHYARHIREFGAPNGLCSSITEAKHIKAVKEPWRRSSKFEALRQMLLTNQRLDKLAASRTDFQARGMLHGTCLSDIIQTFAQQDGIRDDGMDPDVDEFWREIEGDDFRADEEPNDSDMEVEESDDSDMEAEERDEVVDVEMRIEEADADSEHNEGSEENAEDDDEGPVEGGLSLADVFLAKRRGVLFTLIHSCIDSLLCYSSTRVSHSAPPTCTAHTMRRSSVPGPAISPSTTQPQFR